MIKPGLTTVTDAVVDGKVAPEAVMTAFPGATPVTGTLTDAEPLLNVTVEGTVATPVLLDARLTVRLPMAALVRVRVRFCVVAPVIVIDAGTNDTPNPTRTVAVAVAKPKDVTVMIDWPAAFPLILGCEVGVVCPVLKNRFCVESERIDGSLLVSETKVG